MPARLIPRVSNGVLLVSVLTAASVWSAGAAHQPPSPSSEQQKPQVFRAGADVVPVYATVRNPKQGFVLDLTKDDFELYDEGRRQAITQFTIAAQPRWPWPRVQSAR